MLSSPEAMFVKDFPTIMLSLFVVLCLAAPLIVLCWPMLTIADPVPEMQSSDDNNQVANRTVTAHNTPRPLTVTANDSLGPTTDTAVIEEQPAVLPYARGFRRTADRHRYDYNKAPKRIPERRGRRPPWLDAYCADHTTINSGPITIPTACPLPCSPPFVSSLPFTIGQETDDELEEVFSQGFGTIDAKAKMTSYRLSAADARPLPPKSILKQPWDKKTEGPCTHKRTINSDFDRPE